MRYDPFPIYCRTFLLLSYIVEPCVDKIIVISNQLLHIFIKKHIKIIQNSITPTCFGSYKDPSSGGHHQILAKVFTGSWSESI